MSRVVTMKVQEDELEAIDKAAERLAMSRSRYMVWAALSVARNDEGRQVAASNTSAWAMTADQMPKTDVCSHPIDLRMGRLCCVCGDQVN